MVKPLMYSSTTRFTSSSLAAVALLLLHGWSLVAEAADPTRPPAEFLSSGSSSINSGPLSTSPEQGLQLQSILLSPRRNNAVINGQTVQLGERIGDAKLIKLTDTQAVLQNDQGLQILELTPGIRKTPSKPPVHPKIRKKRHPSGGKP